MADSLPHEILINILSRLLTESLLICSLVCKTWRNLIYNDKLFSHIHSRLIYNHGSVAAVSSGKASFVSLLDSGNGRILLKRAEYDDDNEKPMQFGIRNLLLVADHEPCRIVGSCNGLICISLFSNKDDNIDDPIYICNPMTREFVHLPRLRKKFRDGNYVVSGFGYHPWTNQYKVVRIYFHQAVKEKSFVGRVQIYTLGNGDGWRNLEDINYKLHPSISSEILADGGLHWFDEAGKIVKFDLSDETFCILPRPEHIDRWWDLHKNHVKDRDYELGVLGGCLRIIERGKRQYNIWSLKKREDRMSLLPDNDQNDGKQDIEKEHYNTSWNWEKDIFNWANLDHDRFTSVVYPFAILKDNAKILYYNHYSCYRQDLIKGYEYETIADHCLPCDSVRYVKSFVSLKGLGEEKAKIKRIKRKIRRRKSNGIKEHGS